MNKVLFNCFNKHGVCLCGHSTADAEVQVGSGEGWGMSGSRFVTDLVWFGLELNKYLELLVLLGLGLKKTQYQD